MAPTLASPWRPAGRRRRDPPGRLRRMRGLSLVEAMVGLAVGLAIVAAALHVTAQQVRAQRLAVLESRLLHDLGASSELIGRLLRRAGSLGDAIAPVDPVDPAAGASAALRLAPNPYADLAITEDGRQITIAASRDVDEDHMLSPHERVSVRLAAGVLEQRIGLGGWQALTDAGVLVVRSLRFEAPGMPGDCRAAAASRLVSWTIEVQAATQPSLRHSLRGGVWLRNAAVAASPATCL